MSKTKKDQQESVLVRMWRNQRFCAWLVGMQNDLSTVVKGLATSYKCEHIPTLGASNFNPRYLRNKNIFKNYMFTNKNLNKNFYNFISNIKKEEVQVSINMRQNRQIAIYSYNGMLVRNKRNPFSNT